MSFEGGWVERALMKMGKVCLDVMGKMQSSSESEGGNGIACIRHSH